MFIRKKLWPLVIVNVGVIALFSFFFLQQQNYEFLIYVGVVILFFIILLLTDRKVAYPLDLLWGLSIWAFMHVAGGGLFFKGIKLYETMLITFSESYNIFRYDQLVHIFGFMVATYLMYVLLKPLLKKGEKLGWVRLGIVVVMAGLGVGAFNEIVEFTLTVILPETGVGGYINTSLDLVADLIGALLALWYIRILRRGRFLIGIALVILGLAFYTLLPAVIAWIIIAAGAVCLLSTLINKK